MRSILVLIPVGEHHKEQLENAGSGSRFVYSTRKDVTQEMIDQADIIVGNAPVGMIHASKKLELLQLNSAGTDGYCVPGVLADTTILANATGAYSKAVAEHCLIAALMMQKKLHLYRDLQKQNRWEDMGMVTSITDATVLVVGLGDIGLHFSRMAKALGAKKVIGVKRRPGSCPEGVDEVYLTEQLDALLPQADLIASFLPGTPATCHFYTEERFCLMKPTAIFVNGGRGNAAASDVLENALRTNQIAAAAIDVTDPEPLPADSPLWQLDNLLITPHISGSFHLEETLDRIVAIASRNIYHVLHGEPAENIVDMETGYRR